MTLGPFVGERLAVSHRDDIHRMHRDERLMRYLGGTRSEQETDRYMTRNLAHWEHHSFGMWVLRHRASGEVAGRAGLRTLDLDDATEIETGWALFPVWWRQGLGTEVAQACLAYAREVLDLQTVVATTREENAASRGVMRRIGMHFDRHVRFDDVELLLYRAHLR